MSDKTDNFEAVVQGRRPEAVAAFEEEKTLIKRLQHALHVTPSLVPLIVLVVSILIFAVAVDGRAMLTSFGLMDIFAPLIGEPTAQQVNFRFFSASSLSLILQQVQIVGIVAAAQTLVVLTAGIDLSVGAIMVMSSVVMGQFTFRYGLPVELAILCGLMTGVLLGYANGWLVAVMKLPPFIVTLGTWQIILATNFLYSANETIRSQDVRENAPMLQWLGLKPNEQIVRWAEGIPADERRAPEGTGGWMDVLWSINITYGVVVMVVLVVALSWALRNTAWGRHVYAVGDDPDAAQLAGVNVRRTLISVYVLAGLICAIAGWALIGRIGSISPTSGQEANIQSITAVVIGGISLFGGRGSIMGVLFGGLIVGVYELGLRILGADAQWTYLLIGALIIIAVAVDQWIRKATA